jgi:hypothetical protein
MDSGKMLVPLTTFFFGREPCGGRELSKPFSMSFIYGDPSPGIVQYQQPFVYCCNTDVQICSVVVR